MPAKSLPILKESQVIFEESLVKIQRDTLQIEEHLPYHYYVLTSRPAAIVILAQTEDGRFVLTQEYRHPTKTTLLGCPGGYLDEHELPLEAAKRELLEETGYQAQDLVLMGSAFPYAGFTGQKTHYVLARHASYFSSPSLECSEIIQTILMKESELNQAIQSGIPVDGTLCTALFFYHLKFGMK